jgi:protoporphyrinogen oxidase
MARDKKRVVILGAGPCGLGAGYNLMQKGYQVYIIDRAHYVGGASASFRIKDYIVDYGPHAFHVKDEGIVRMITDLIGDGYNKVRRNSRLILDGKNLQYPLNIKEALLKISPLLSLKILIDYLVVRVKSYIFKSNQIQTFQDWGIEAFGNTLYRLAFGNYSEKMWGVSGSQLSCKLAQQKLLKLNLLKIILKVLGITDATFEGGVAEYYDLYPRLGIGVIFEEMRDRILKGNKNEIHLDAKILDINASGNKLENICFENNGRRISRDFDYLISTIPLKYLSEYLFLPERDRIKVLAQQLKYRDIRIIYVVLDKDYFSDIHWIYLLDSHFRFNRLSEQKNLNRESSPSGKTVISLDISCNFGDEIWNMTDEDFFKLALSDLFHLGIEESHISDYFSLKLQDVYPIYDLNFDIHLKGILKIIEQYPNLYLTGRQGLFLNNDIHDSIEMGKLCSMFILKEKSSHDWYEFIGEYIRNKLEGKKI